MLRRALLTVTVATACSTAPELNGPPTSDHGRYDVASLERAHAAVLAWWTPEREAAARALVAAEHPSPSARLEAIVAGDHRLEGHAGRDAARHPVETLTFFGVEPDDRVVELEPGAGWYTELLAPYVAQSGSLRLPSYDPDGDQHARSTYVGKALALLLSARPALFEAVETIPVELGALTLGDPESADVVLSFREFHNWARFGHVEDKLRAAWEVLVPGGTLGIVAHRRAEPAPAGVPGADGYLSQAWVVERVTAAGFELVATSEVNANPKDTADYEHGVWTLPPTLADEAMRTRAGEIGESDRMTLRFRKPARRRLVVLVVVDQLRADVLDRMRPHLDAGLARVLDRGAVFEQAHHGHGLTLTGPGHATLATGVDPARHGIVANAFVDRGGDGEKHAAVADLDVAPLGGPVEPRSPAQLRRSAVGDWLRAHHPEAKVVTVALKDRAAIATGGQHPNWALWHDADAEGFVSSTWYGQALPDWVAAFNAEANVPGRVAAGWTRRLPAAVYDAFGPDSVTAEGDGTHMTFPYTAPLLAALGDPHEVVRAMPAGVELTFEMALAAVEGAALGEDDTPDFLGVCISTTDYIGHRFGPESHEFHDTVARLDVTLARFLDALDERVGAAHYSVVLTSDHGVRSMPEIANDGTRVTWKEVGRTADRHVKATAAALKMRVPKATIAGGVVLEFAGRVSASRRSEFRAALADRLRTEAWVADAFTADELEDPVTPLRPHLEALRRSHDPERSADVALLPARDVLLTYGPHGTGHGTPYEHDSHVPLAIYGAGVMPGVHAGRVETTAVAPTLAALLGVEPPRDLDGAVLEQALAGPTSPPSKVP